MENRQVKLEIKNVSDQGVFSGMASVFGNLDFGGDVVEPGAFTRTLAHKGGEVPILFSHDTAQPIGLGKLRELQRGLEINGELVMEAAKAREVYALMKKGVLKGLSIGYEVVRDTVINGVRHLQELKLFEVSVVCFPMNELATIQSVKSGETDQVALFRRVLQECSRSF